MQLFFGWEAVGLVSYLLIGFWYKRPSAIFANLKAFLVNRVGDFGFLLGIAGIAPHGRARCTTPRTSSRRLTGSRRRPFEIVPGHVWSGADGRLHLPVHRRDGQVGPGAAACLAARLDGRPDADLGADPRRDDGHRGHLHGRPHVAAVRVVRGTALSFVLVIGATTALFMGFLIGIVNNDIKRVVAYSTLSQLGYMTVALGVSAYAGAIFHLMTHAFFKALLFLACGLGHHRRCITSRTCAGWAGCASTCPITYSLRCSARWR
jgi:NADH-quinone oxidoreductase subunit L